MALPKLQQPLFELTIPSTNKKVKYRPFTVKEEKILLIAQETKEIEQIVLSIKQIINNCVQGVDVDKLAMFDLEYLLINTRARSVSNIMEFKIKDPETEEEVELEIDIDEVKIHKDKKHDKNIKINDSVTIGMKYPKIDQLIGMNDKDQNEALFDLMIGCIDTVVDGDEVYKLTDFSDEEIEEFVESFSTEHINKIRDFFETMPVLKIEKEYTRKDGTKKTFVAQGTETFFI